MMCASISKVRWCEERFCEAAAGVGEFSMALMILERLLICYSLLARCGVALCERWKVECARYICANGAT